MKFLKPTLVAVALVSVFGCQQEVKEEKPVVLESDVQKQAYSLGSSIGAYITKNLEQQEELGMGLDSALITQGFIDALAGKSLVTEEEIKETLQAMNQELQTKQQAKLAADAEAGLEAGKQFLAENAKKDGVQVTASGLQYAVIEEAEGEKPLATDTVKVHYKGTLISGETFDSSYDRGEPVSFPLNRVIAGWTEGVQLMSVGSKYKFTIPSDLAYGEQGRPPQIPGNSVLEFEIELLDIQKAQAPAEAGE